MPAGTSSSRLMASISALIRRLMSMTLEPGSRRSAIKIWGAPLKRVIERFSNWPSRTSATSDRRITWSPRRASISSPTSLILSKRPIVRNRYSRLPDSIVPPDRSRLRLRIAPRRSVSDRPRWASRAGSTSTWTWRSSPPQMATSDMPATEARRGLTLSCIKSSVMSMFSWRGLPGSASALKNIK